LSEVTEVAVRFPSLARWLWASLKRILFESYGQEPTPNVIHQWMDDCLRWHGRVLTGGFRHYCPDWDFLPIDASVAEFGACTCPLPDTMDGHWLHRKSGHSYAILEHRLVVLESDLTELVLYMRSDGSGPIWARPADQFFDGRFLRMKR
jgi:hypothetical protein